MAIQLTAKTPRSELKDGAMGKKKEAKKVESPSKSEELVIELNLTTIIAVIVVLVVAVVGIWFLTRQITPDGGIAYRDPTGFEDGIVPEVKASSFGLPILGDVTAPVTIVEFADQECIYCRLFSIGYNPQTQIITRPSAFDQIKTNYIDKKLVRYVFAPYVASPQHNPAALNEAVATFCANEQSTDAFWGYKEKVFERTKMNGIGLDGNQSSEDTLVKLAEEFKLDKAKFTDCYRRRDVTKINEIKSWVETKVKDAFDKKSFHIGTPLIVVCRTVNNSQECEGKAFSGAYPYEEVKKIIDGFLPTTTPSPSVTPSR